MGLRDIINIIRDEQLCKNWDLEEENNLLSLFYEKYNLHMMYDNGNLITIFHMKIHNNEIREHIRTKYKIECQRSCTIFSYQDNFYIQTIYKRFSKEIVLDHITIYSDIENHMEIVKNDKKDFILYPIYNINEEIEQILNYPILDSELL